MGSCSTLGRADATFIPMRRDTFRCARCGASTSPKLERCEYCDAWLVHLTVFESVDPRGHEDSREGETGELGGVRPPPDATRRFRSLAPLYVTALAASLALFVWLYFVAFDRFSETALVTLSPAWFLGFHFGVSGLFTERALDAVLRGDARTFREGLTQAMGRSTPIVRVAVALVFFPPFLLLGLRRVTSPLLLSLFTTLAWAALLYGFFLGVFPNL